MKYLEDLVRQLRDPSRGVDVVKPSDLESQKFVG